MNWNFRTCQISKKKFYNRSHFEANLICIRRDFDECFPCRKSLSTLLSRKNANLFSYAISQKPWYREKKEKKQFLNQVFQIRNRFWNRFLTTRQTLNQEFQNMSDFQSTLNNSSFLESEFLQHVKFWNIFLTTRQILIRNFNNAKDLYVKLVLKKEFSWTNCFQMISQKCQNSSHP